MAMARRELEPWTSTPHLDAQLLLTQVVHQPRAWVLAHPEASLLRNQALAFVEALGRLCRGEALPYVLGWWEFFGRRFRVTAGVLIPRPETELLVEGALTALHRRPPSGWVLDLGTGSGCIAVTLALESPEYRIIAADLSADALRVARWNAQRYDVESQIRFVLADLMQPFRGPFDLICANLPYIPSGSVEALDVGRREPRLALDGGVDGLASIRRALVALPGRLTPNGTALFEIQADQGESALGAARAALPGAKVSVRADLAGRDRLLVIERLAEP